MYTFTVFFIPPTYPTHRISLRDLQIFTFLLVLTTTNIRLLFIFGAEILLTLYIIIWPSLQSYCNIKIEYR